MPDPEIKLLRDKNARLISEIKKLIAENERMVARIRVLEAAVLDLQTESNGRKRRLGRYENAHTPSSTGSIPTEQKKAANRNGGGQAPVKNGRPGGRPGHKGVTRRPRADQTVHHTPDRCGNCGSTEHLTPGRITCEMQQDLKNMPETVVTNNVMHEVDCGNCGHTTKPRGAGIPGTSVGPNAAAVMVQLYASTASNAATASFMRDVFGFSITKGAVVTAMRAISGALRGVSEGIGGDVGRCTSVHVDETGAVVRGKKCWVWLAIGNPGDGTYRPVKVHVNGSRGAAVVMEHFNYQTTYVVDGYSGYKHLELIQRCWAHILRESEYAARDNRQAHTFHQMLQLLFHDAKLLDPGQDRRGDIRRLESRALAIADMFEPVDSRFATKLRNAVPDLFTFVRCPGVEPTNNAAERALRPVVIARKVRLHLMNTDGMRTFERLMTCILTWKANGLSPAKMTLKALCST